MDVSLLSTEVVAFALFGAEKTFRNSASKFSTDSVCNGVVEEGRGAVRVNESGGKERVAGCEKVLDGVISG